MQTTTSRNSVALLSNSGLQKAADLLP